MKKQKKLVIVGDGEFAQIAFEYFTYDSDYEIIAFAVENDYLKQDNLCGLPVVQLETLETLFPPDQYEVFVAVTHTKLNTVRRKLFEIVKRKGYTCATYISSRAFVWRNVQVGENCFVFENNVVQPFCEIGNDIILWSGNHVGHRSVIEDHAYLSSHVVVSGYCRLGSGSFFGVNATLVDNITIAPDNFIAAGAVVTRTTEAGQFLRGNPASPSKASVYEFFKLPVTVGV